MPEEPSTDAQAEQEYLEHFGPPETAFPSNSALKEASIFFVLYIVAAVPTYILPYAGSNSAFANGISAGFGAGMYPLFYVHLTFLYILAILAWFRGTLVGRPWLPILPIFAAIFDLVPGFNWVPLIPTGFHIATLVIGVNKPVVRGGVAKEGAIAAYVGLAALALFAIVKWANYGDATQQATRSFAQSLTPDTTLSQQTAPPNNVPSPDIAVEKVVFGTRAAPDGSILDAQDTPPASHEFSVQWYYTGAQPGDRFSCDMNDKAEEHGVIEHANGWVGCHWVGVPFGMNTIELRIGEFFGNTREVFVPASTALRGDQACSSVPVREIQLANAGENAEWINIPPGCRLMTDLPADGFFKDCLYLGENVPCGGYASQVRFYKRPDDGQAAKKLKVWAEPIKEK